MDVPSNNIASSIEAVRAAAKKVKLSQELEDCLEQLKSIDKLLEISKPWPAAFQRLGALLRERLLPLYKTFPILGLRFSVSVLATIYETRILSAVKSDDDVTKASWEVVQTAILSGILDFLEARSSSENRAIVATTVYPTLRRIFFPQTAIYQASPELMYILYQLLSETVTSHPDNQAQLRKEETLGSAQIGAALSQTKGFLVIEALLELFVKLIPSKTSIGGIQARMAFIREVFGSFQARCTASIVELFETTSTTDWEEIFIKIINLLAHVDISFPQPFKISNFHFEGSKACQIARLYVDHRGFVGNIDEGDQIETFHALFTSVQGIKMTAPSKSKACVTMLLSSPPSVGQVAIAQQSDGNTTVIFDVEGNEVAKFKRALINRGVKNIEQAGIKLSTAEKTVELDHDKKHTAVPVSTQDKARDLARLWDASNSLLQSGEVLPTSPLVPPKSPSVRIMSSEFPSRLNAQPPAIRPPQTPTPLQIEKTAISSPYYDSIFGSTDEELTDLSDLETEPVHRTSRSSFKQETRSKAETSGLVESEDDIPSAPRSKGRNKTIVVSDDEIGSPSPSPRPTTHTSLRVSTRSSIATKLVKIKSVAQPPVRSSATEKENTPPKGHTSGALHEAADFSPQSPAQTPAHVLAPQPVEQPRGRKRKAIGHEIQQVPSKRPKTDSAAAKPVHYAAKSAPRRPPPRLRYGGKKGRTSSPTPATDLDFDFDELPAPSTDAASAKSTDRRSRVSAMRGKSGKARVKPEPTKPVIVNSDSNLVVEFQSVKLHKKQVKPIIETKETIINSKIGKSDDLVESKPVKKSPKKQAKSAGKIKEAGEEDRLKKVNVAGNIQPTKKSRNKQVKPINHETDVDDKPKPQRRSARVAKIDNRPEAVQNGAVEIAAPSESPATAVNDVVEKNVRSRTKPRHAPWMDLDTKTPVVAPLALAPAPAQPVAASDPPIIDEDHPLTFDDPVTIADIADPVLNAVADRQEVTEDYFIPLKTGSISSIDEAPQSDHVMIDLTQDSPPKLISSKLVVAKPVVALPVSRVKTYTPAPTVAESPAANQMVTKVNEDSMVATAVVHEASNCSPVQENQALRSPVPRRFLPNTGHNRVSFAPAAAYRPYRVEYDSVDAEQSPPPKRVEALFTYKPRPPKQLEKKMWDDEEAYSGPPPPRKHHADPMARIIDTIKEITNVVLQTTSHRFDKVSKDLRAGQRSILQQTAEELQVMYDESVQHFYDDFVTLESAYASHHRNITAALENASKINQEVSSLVAGSIQEHNRNSLSRKYPNTFFSSPLPTVLSNPKLVL